MNAIDAGLGGTGEHHNTLAALNSICELISGAGGHTSNLSAWNEIAGIGLLDTSLFEFLWIAGNFDGDNLLSSLDTDVLTVTGKDFSTDYIPVTSAATFAIPDTATYKDADTDNFWHTGATILQKTVTQLITTDNNRTFVKYADEAPHHITAIGILKQSVTLNDAQKDRFSGFFWLWLYYFGVFNDYGHLKENRPVEEDPYCAAFRAVYDSWTTKPSEAVATAMDTMVRALVDGGVWAKLDCFELFAAHTNDAGESLKDWVNLSRTVAASSTPPTFTAYQGFLGVPASSTFINTGFIPSNGVQFAQNNNSIGIYNRTARAAGTSYNHGCYNNTGTKGVTLQPRSGAGNFIAYNNSATGGSQATTTSQGFLIARRDSSSSMDLWMSGVEVGADKAINTNARPTVAFYVNALNTDGTAGSFAIDEIACFFAGAYLTNAEIATITNAVEAYMDSNSKGIIA